MDEELNPSSLGSLEFWNDVYSQEVINYKDHGDVGEIWFGKEVARKIIKWLDENTTIKKSDSILDIGCGNGMLLVDLSSKGFNNLHGIDYSKNAIELALEISKNKNCCINFFVGNILDNLLTDPFTVVLDKGTYDAISLDPEDSKSKRYIYISNIYKLLEENGYFIITSCNWTELELQKHFNDLEFLTTLPAPTFQFGGQSGKTTATVIFKKKMVLV